MGRLPFDPSKMRGAKPPEPARPGAGEGVLTVSRLAAMIRGVVEDHLPPKVRVVGEVSGARRSTHLYFGLKDAGALISAALFASNLRKLGFEPRDGQEVVATGRVEFYEPQGRVTLIVEKLEPVGQGAHELRFKQLCEELRALGWFAPERKRPLPTFPRKVAVVTSRTGAALQDVLDTMARRCPAVGVVLVPVKVQGDAASGQVARALRDLSRRHESLGIDAAIVTRGGGSPEDLAAFNERAVAQAIVECEIPVVAAIGHETDTTIAELVADERCATPTQAAMRLTPDRDALHRQLDALGSRFRTDLARTIRYERQRLSAAARHPVLADPCGATRLGAGRLGEVRRLLAGAIATSLDAADRRSERTHAALHRLRPSAQLLAARAELNGFRARLRRAAATGLSAQAARVTTLRQHLESVGPGAVLARGYSCTTRQDGRVIRDASEVAIGERLTTHLGRGSIESEVVSASDAQTPPDASRPTSKPSKGSDRKARPAGGQPTSPAPEPDQLDLFGGAG